MTTFEIVEAEPRHLFEVASRLRDAHRGTLQALGYRPGRQLREAFRISAWRRAWVIDGVTAAVGGVSGSLLESTGIVWLAMTNEATGFPVAALREARRQLREIMETKTELQSVILLQDEASWRLAAALGFFVKHPSHQPGAATLSIESRKTSPECILRAAPEFEVRLPSGGAAAFVGFRG